MIYDMIWCIMNRDRDRGGIKMEIETLVLIVLLMIDD